MGMLRFVTTLMQLTSAASDAAKQPVYVGIDLGTTFSCVSMYSPKTKQYEYLYFDGDNPETIPSVVYVEDKKRDGVAKFHVGYDAIAKNRETPNKSNYFYGFKRLMGIPYSDKVVQDFENSVTYGVREHVVQRGS